MLIPTENGPGEYDPGTGLVTVEGSARPLTDAEARMLAATEAHMAVLAAAALAQSAVAAAKGALSDVLSLADAYPYPTPEENAIIDNQVVAALTGYRALDDPPADVVALAAAVVSWRATT